MLDISDTGSVFDTINRVRPEMVIHCAAMTDVDGCERDPDAAYKINAVGTWNLACACASIDCPIAYVSTDYVFDGEKGAPYTEFDTPNPISAYGASKLAGEQAVHRALPEALRRAHVVAVRAARQELRPEHTQGGRGRPELRVVADQIGSPTYAKDLAEFLAGAGRIAALWHLSLHERGAAARGSSSRRRY